MVFIRLEEISNIHRIKERMSSFSEDRLMANVQFFNDQLITVPQFKFPWTLDVAVRLELFQQSTRGRVVKPPIKFVLLVRTTTDCIYYFPSLPWVYILLGKVSYRFWDKFLQYGGIYFFQFVARLYSHGQYIL